MIKLSTFGDPSLFAADGTRIDVFPSRYTKKFALLIYLACAEGRPACRRDELVAVFWPEADKARALNSLRQALFVIRRELGPDVIAGCGSQEITVDGRYLRSDLDAFTAALKEGRAEVALGLYDDDFLSGFHVSGAPAFGFWVDERREHLRAEAARAAEGLARRAEAGQALSDAVFWWRRRLDIEPYHEPTIRRIVSLLAAAGDRTSAMRELERFRHRVRREIEVDVSATTLELASKLASGALSGPPSWIGDRRRGGSARRPWSALRRATDTSQV